MHPTIRGGFLLGAAVATWTVIMGSTGWYKQPGFLYLFWLVIPIQVAILVHFLRLSAPRTSYGRQVWIGVGISLLGSILIFANSYYLTAVKLPHYFQDMEALGRQLMAQRGLSPDQINEAIQKSAPMQTSLATAMAGAIGTVVTGAITSAFAALWLHKK